LPWAAISDARAARGIGARPDAVSARVTRLRRDTKYLPGRAQDFPVRRSRGCVRATRDAVACALRRLAFSLEGNAMPLAPRYRLARLAACLWLAAGGATAQQGDGTRVAAEANVFKPQKVAATQERVASLKVAPGFRVAVFAEGLKNARVIAVAPGGLVYVSRRDQGDVVMLRDADGDGRADGPARIVASRPGAHGLAYRNGKLFVATVKEVFVADVRGDGSLGPFTMLVGDLPDAGQHANRTIAFGPDGMLYVSVGSTCNACNESNQENATLLRMRPDGLSRIVFATGLRNTIGFGWHPATGELWGMDHGIDYLGDDQQPEELNRIEHGKRYGWPHVWGDGGLNPQSTPTGDVSKEAWRATSVPMVLGYTAHAAPMQLVFYPAGGSFPREYAGDAFVTMRGSWNRLAASGYEVVRLRFQDGKPVAFEPFVTGFLVDGGQAHFARPMGLAVAGDGALLVGDDANGVIYRVASVDAARVSGALDATREAPDAPMLEQVSKGIGVPLARERPEARASGRLEVSSPTIAPGGRIPKKHSEYADGVSPALAWTRWPGARSYAVIVEDPDAKPMTPFVHWVAWNIPPDATSLPEGLQEQGRLTEPDGVLQGRTTRGTVGYLGPRPPVGDPPHRYHFQVLALDAMLDVPFGASRDEVLAAARGRVLASGVLVGRYAQDVEPPR
jgi:Raf kinase inhibitor-like YbhB/YbcL family protein